MAKVRVGGGEGGEAGRDIRAPPRLAPSMTSFGAWRFSFVSALVFFCWRAGDPASAGYDGLWSRNMDI